MGIENGVVIFLAVLLVIAFLLLVFMLVKYFGKFKREKQRIITEMNRADDENEYIERRKELRCHYLCLIPFVTKRNVMKVYRFFFRTEKREEKVKRDDGFLHILVPSVVGACVCAVCLCGVSWAWFTESASIGTSTIKTPERYEIAVSVSDSDNNSLIALNGEYILSGNYTVTLTASGTNGATGYCKVEIGDVTYYTDQIFVESTLTFKVTAQAEVTVTITPKWGSCAVGTDENKIGGGSTLTYSDTGISVV